MLDAIATHLSAPNPRDALASLFCEILHWGQPQGAPFTHMVTVRQCEKISLTFVPVAHLSSLPVLRVDWPWAKLPTISQRRAVYRALDAAYTEHLLIYITADGQQIAFVWARPLPSQAEWLTIKPNVEIRALPYTVGTPARSTLECLSKLALSPVAGGEQRHAGQSPALPTTKRGYTIRMPSQYADKLNAAFDVEALSQTFFVHYQRMFEDLHQTGYQVSDALQTLNRLLFSYFRPWDCNIDIPDGLTRHNTHTMFAFTTSESTPFDIEVAVTPEIIGRAYERLVNVSESGNRQGKKGVFYTSHVEIDLMCRLALVDWLAQHLGQAHKPALYTAVFAFDEVADATDKANNDNALGRKHWMRNGLWSQLSDLLDTVTVVDPACGSGSFLVGMLQVLDDLVARADAQVGRKRTPYERRQHIIAHNLYGMDVMAGAVQITKLRLGLQLAHEADSSQRDSDCVCQVRQGDSLMHPAHHSDAIETQTFAEVFNKRPGGFDIVIGNPPYVRQEAIHDPRTPPDQVTHASKRAYKHKLARAVYAAWPYTFGYDKTKDKPTWPLNARSDLYIYFYFHALSLLNSPGTLCFVTPNAWLDVGYGKDLQQLLLTRGQVKLVLDNQVRRSFTSADVNTVIVLLGPAHDAKSARQASLRHTARFVMLSVPFEDVLTPTIWEEVARTTTRQTTSDYRVFPLTQADLLENGMDEKQRFSGDKWGGKYLRAPDIYWVIMEKARDKLVRLGDIADVRRGFTTGANAFFYLDEETIAQWGIEDRFLEPVLKSPRECKRIVVERNDFDYQLFLCHKNRQVLQNTAALAYIKYGETQGFHKRPTCRGRARWWDLGPHTPPDGLWMKAFNDRFVFPINIAQALASDRFYEISFFKAYAWPQIAASLNNTLTVLSAELNGRVSLGGGALDNMTYEATQNLVVRPELLPPDTPIFTREVLPIADETRQPDRRSLDVIIFDMLGLTQGERDAVYEAVVTMVEARLHKAQSLR